MKNLSRMIPPVAFALLAMSPPAAAQSAESAEPGAQELAKKLSNPIADLISIPLQWNWEQGVGLEESTRTVLNFQPVVPFSLTPKWNLVSRMVMPLVSQPVLFPGGEADAGVGDVLLSGFFSRARPRGAIWGVGPVIAVPSNEGRTLSSGRWSAGELRHRRRLLPGEAGRRAGLESEGVGDAHPAQGQALRN